ncbi:LysM domain-containing protein [Candidatus Woesearchaeota archaeon]|nr:LysM domain-containing protein [Candidatus Woesearchaeota archaeon]
MNSFDKHYRAVTGKSRVGGAVSGFYNGLKIGFHRAFVDSSRARLRTGLAVLTLAGIITYVSNKDSVDLAVDSWKNAFVEFKEDRVLVRAERRTSNQLRKYESELVNLREEYGLLRSKKDSLNYLVVDLESKVSSGISSYDSLLNDLRSKASLSNARSKESIVVDSYNSSVDVKGPGWVRIPKGSSLSSIASKYYGDVNVYKDLARINNIENPNFVLRGQPLLLVEGNLKTYDGVLNCDFPSFKEVNTFESLDGFLSRVGVSVSKQEIIDFNNSTGNTISDRGRLVDYSGVVHLKKEWVK